MGIDVHRKKSLEDDDCNEWKRTSDTITIKKTTVFWAVALLVGMTYFYHIHLHPRHEVVRFLLEMHGDANITQDRLPVKIRMTDPFLLFLAYPISHVLVNRVGLKNYPNLITANMVSALHPLFAALSVYFILSAAFWFRSPPHKGMDTKSTLDEPNNAFDIPNRLRIPFSEDTYIAVSSSNAETAVDGKSRVSAIPLISFSDKNISTARLRIAALCMWMRNVLDATDGVLSRAHTKAGVVASPSFLLMDGASVDIATDLVGVFAFFASIVIQFHTRKVMIIAGAVHTSAGTSRSWAQRIQLYFYSKVHPVFVARAIPVSACFMIIARGICWEYVVPLFSSIFDGNPSMYAMERTFLIQLVYFLWGISCIDALLSYVIIACALNKLWVIMCHFAFWGWIWTLMLLSITYLVHTHVMSAEPPHALLQL